ncbi:MAG TPA: tRNA 2-selenouridine(34) synthase MnmH [Bacteroidia bacterium]|nr:tRNA 2-selenouridine(34) synthase MnmH [Bacteroidia bacterium]
MPQTISIEAFLKYAESHPIIDVRSEGEFAHSCIPTAINIPLFTNEERKIVGTLYKQEGRQPAILKGLELVGPKMKSLVENINAIKNNGTFLMYCWRGGMRSASVAWLLETYGYKVFVLKGGYKSFRKIILNSFESPIKLVILGGRTGTGKTLLLEKLAEKNQQIIDLEKLACHKGSAFGALGEKEQPSQEQFENLLGLSILSQKNNFWTWIEDESKMIGKKVIPQKFWNQMRQAPVVYVDIPFEIRANYLLESYGKFSVEALKGSIFKIKKRLGGLQTKLAVEAVEKNDLETVCKICLAYYDKSYDFGLSQRENKQIEKIIFEEQNISAIANELIKRITENNLWKQ